MSQTPLTSPQRRLLELERQRAVFIELGLDPTTRRYVGRSIDAAYMHVVLGERMLAEAEAAVSTGYDMLFAQQMRGADITAGNNLTYLMRAFRDADEDYGVCPSLKQMIHGPRSYRVALVAERLRNKYGTTLQEEQHEQTHEP